MASVRSPNFMKQHPFVFNVQGQEYRVDYLPAESNTGMFGGNSNWRGPVWMPVNVMIIRALLNFYLYYGDNFKIECPTGSGKMMNLFEVVKGNLLTGSPASLPEMKKANGLFMAAWKNSRMIQTGVTIFSFMNTSMATMVQDLVPATRPAGPDVVAKIIELFGLLDAKQTLEGGKQSAFIHKDRQHKKTK